jgi:hypothetical protein
LEWGVKGERNWPTQFRTKEDYGFMYQFLVMQQKAGQQQAEMKTG